MAATVEAGQGGQYGNGGRGRGGGNHGFSFTPGEINSLLDIIEDILPIGLIKWGLVSKRHKVIYAAKNRDVNLIRCKFTSLAIQIRLTTSAVPRIS